MDFELWQLPLGLWQLPLELWQLPLALWHYSKSKVDVLGTLATASGALATASRALATASRTLANISWLSNNVFVFWQLPGISSASSDSLIRHLLDTYLNELDFHVKWPIHNVVYSNLNWNWLINGCFMTISGHFFSICIFKFHKTEVQMVNLNWFKTLWLSPYALS